MKAAGFPRSAAVLKKQGGTVTVHSLPVFVLEVTLPDKESIYDARYDR